MANENGKDVANSLSSYSNALNKGTNVVLDSANQINKWYAEQVNKIAGEENQDTRLETNVDNSIEEDTEEKINKIHTKVDDYTEIQTNNKNKLISNQNTGRLKIINTDETLEDAVEKENEVKDLGSKKGKINSKISTAIKGVKVINNTANRFVKTGKTLNTATNEDGLKSFEKSSSRIMTKPARKVADKVTSKATKVAMKIVAEAVKLLLSMLPSIAPVVIIIVIIATIGSFFNFKNTHEADDINFDDISSMIIVIEDEKLQAIYNEFLKNMGKPYLMDHSNLSHDTCMEYYDCSSWTIHCLAHAGIKVISNTRSTGNLYKLL